MIVVDSSCVLAILQNEPERDAFAAALAGGDRCVMSAVNVHETLCVMRGRHGQAGAARVWELLAAAEKRDRAFRRAASARGRRRF